MVGDSLTHVPNTLHGSFRLTEDLIIPEPQHLNDLAL